MALTKTQDGALYALRHGARWDASEIRGPFEISAQYTSVKKMKTTSEPLYLVSLGRPAGIPIA
jgi:hypothetical protein